MCVYAYNYVISLPCLREIAILEMQIKIITVTVCCHPFYYCTGVTLYNFIGHNNDENKKCVRKGKYGVGFFFFYLQTTTPILLEVTFLQLRKKLAIL